MIKIKNLRNSRPSKPYDFYCDRRSKLGNPFPMKNKSYYERHNVCNKYEKFFYRELLKLKEYKESKIYLKKIIDTYKIFGKIRLFCWCYPKRCHIETIKKYIEKKGIKNG